MTLLYGQPGMVIARGKVTARAVRALQDDLILNNGRGEDGDAPVGSRS